MLRINNDAIFIADSHTQNGRDSLILMLNKIAKNATPSQIFLLGDIGNIFLGNLRASIKSNEMLIKTLDFLSQKTQIIYFEGNHDFHLTPILPRILKIPREKQPLLASFSDKKISDNELGDKANSNKKCGNKLVLLSHGDIFLDKKYEIYIKMLNAKITGKILNWLDLATFGRLYKIIEKKVQNKNIRLLHDESAISRLIRGRIKSYQSYILRHNLKVDFVIEGHFHLGKIITPNAMSAFVGDSSNVKDSSDSSNVKDSCNSNNFKDSSDSNPKDLAKDSNKSSDFADNLTKEKCFFYVALPSFFYDESVFRISECDFVQL